jgi:hypothetical protein
MSLRLSGPCHNCTLRLAMVAGVFIAVANAQAQWFNFCIVKYWHVDWPGALLTTGRLADHCGRHIVLD